MTQALVLPGTRDWYTVGEALAANGVQPGERVRFMGMYTPEEWGERERIKNAQFYLVLNGRSEGTSIATVEPMVCDKCGAGRYPTKPHKYLTYMCIERPFRGLDEALFALAVTRDDAIMERAVLDWQDFALMHPFTARQYQDPFSEQLLSFAVGTAVPIPEPHAKRLASVINGRRPPSRLVM